MPEKPLENRALIKGVSVVAALAATVYAQSCESRPPPKAEETQLRQTQIGQVVGHLSWRFFEEKGDRTTTQITPTTTTLLPDEHTTRPEASRGSPRTPATTTTMQAPMTATTPTTESKPAITTTTNMENNNRISLGNFVVTCYAQRGRTASGTIAGPETIAADPHVLAFGAHLQMDGYDGYVRDTGGAIKGKRLDIWKASERDCINWGRKTLPVFRLLAGPPSPNSSVPPTEQTTTPQPASTEPADTTSSQPSLPTITSSP